MFPDLSCSDELSSYAKPALLLFSSAVFLGCYVYKDYQKYQDLRKTLAIQKWYSITQIYYPHCYNKIMRIYEAAGLIPLIIKALHDRPDDQVLSVVNNIVQATLAIRTPDIIENDAYLLLIETRLNQLYARAGLTKQPTLDRVGLKRLLFEDLNLEDGIPDPTVDAKDIKEIRKNIKTCIEPQSHLGCLNYLAKDLDALQKLFGQRVFVKTVLGVTEVIREGDLTSQPRIEQGGAFMSIYHR